MKSTNNIASFSTRSSFTTEVNHSSHFAAPFASAMKEATCCCCCCCHN